MAPRFDRNQILKADSDRATYYLTKYALEFAVLGLLDDARELVSMLNKYNIHHRLSTILRPLWLAWAETGSWPEKEHERVEESLDDIAEGYRRGLFSRSPQPSRNSPPSGNYVQELREIVRNIEDMNGQYANSTTGSNAMDKSQALVGALDLRLAVEEQRQEGPTGVNEHSSLGEQASLPTVEDILNWIGQRLHCNSQIYYLAQSKRAWKILRSGALARRVGVQNAIVTKLAQDVKDAFSYRFANGKQKTLDLPIYDLLQKYRNNIHARLEMRKGKYVTDPESPPVLRSGATTEQISDLEKRLSVKLPEDYKEFLSISDGFEELSPVFGDSCEELLPMFSEGLHPASEVNWEEDEDYFTELGIDLLECPFIFQGKHGGFHFPLVGRTIQIGQEDIINIWLLPPSNVARIRGAYLRILDSEEVADTIKKAVLDHVVEFCGSRDNFENLEWCVLSWTSGGSATMVAYPSFRAYLERRVEDSNPPPSDKEDWKDYCFAYGCR